MYSPDEKRKAIELFIKYDHSATAVVNELGYPSRGLLYIWHRQYQELGEKAFANRMPRYNDEEKGIAVEHCFEHGRCLARTMRMLGCPKSSELLSNWVRELEPGRSKPKRAARAFAHEQGKSAAIDLESRRSSADEVANSSILGAGACSAKEDPAWTEESPFLPTPRSCRRRSRN